MYTASDKRYGEMIYNRCGASGLKLPAVSLGLWQFRGYGKLREYAPDLLYGI